MTQSSNSPKKPSAPPDSGSDADSRRQDGSPISAENGVFPLSDARAGKTVRIAALGGGHHLNMRLRSMGIIPGVRARVIQNTRVGPFILALRCSRIVLGRGMARQILARYFEGDPSTET